MTSTNWFRGGLAALGLLILVLVVLCWLWSSEPDAFDVEALVRDNAADQQQPIVTGTATVTTLIHVAETLLNKPGGYLSNDIMPPGAWLDNLPNWEFGALVQVRDLTRALRKDFSRSQSQSTEDSDLAIAEPQFNFDNSSWMFPATESEYEIGIRALKSYLKRLSETGAGDAQFYARADNLRNWLADVETRLGRSIPIWLVMLQPSNPLLLQLNWS